MAITPTECATVLDLLAATPHRLVVASRDRPQALLHAKPEADGWSANDILAHLRACADVWGKSMAAMLTQDQPTLRYLSPRTWLRKTTYPALAFHPSLQAFTEQRHTLLRTLQTLTPADWARGATFTGTTRGRTQTVLRYAQRMAIHEGVHCEQLEALLRQS